MPVDTIVVETGEQRFGIAFARVDLVEQSLQFGWQRSHRSTRVISPAVF
jgi:hypothetical protein